MNKQISNEDLKRLLSQNNHLNQLKLNYQEAKDQIYLYVNDLNGDDMDTYYENLIGFVDGVESVFKAFNLDVNLLVQDEEE